jgi:hypothetical protein
MKTMKTMMAGILITSTLFTACRKDNNMMVDPASPTSASTRAASAPVMTFGEGTLITSNIMMTEASGRTIYGSDRSMRIDLWSPVVSGYNVTPGTYKGLHTTLYTVPLDGRPAVMLKGKTLLRDGSVVPVTFVIDQPAIFRSVSTTASITDQTNFLTLLNLNPVILTQNITEEMVANMDRTDQGIMISSEMNPDYYQMILDQISLMTRLDFGVYHPPLPPAPTSPAPTAAIQ